MAESGGSPAQNHCSTPYIFSEYTFIGVTSTGKKYAKTGQMCQEKEGGLKFRMEELACGKQLASTALVPHSEI